ncbi:zinc ribbon domain-containing protein [Methanococcoides sp. NM1]|uniref:zinc ribbon domain-containing protein n=1 Tax=Methanococcoides sp. NM1 TaxID=1201013 RepID=UPI001AF02077|nr:zinc ribbon domain-containing protein [Methanococcoides sp. NM1]
MNEDEVYCSSCGKIIKSEAEICPHCGVRQIQNVPQTSYGSDIRIYELQKLAEKDSVIAIILSLLITPLGYVYVGKWGLAIINFLTLNYLLFGIIIVPIHTYSMISNARKELDTIGVDY